MLAIRIIHITGLVSGAQCCTAAGKAHNEIKEDTRAMIKAPEAHENSVNYEFL